MAVPLAGKGWYGWGMKSKMIPRSELFALVGVTGQKNSKEWEEWGLPYVVRKSARGGRPAHWYDRETALNWLARNATFAISDRAKKALRNLESEPPEEVEDSPGEGEESKAERGAKREGKPPTAPAPCWNMEPGTAGAFARMKEAELAFSSMLCAALAKGNFARAVTCAGQVVALADGMAKLEAHLQGRKDGAGAVEVAAVP